MTSKEDILDLPEPKKQSNEFKWLRYISLFSFILALLFRFFRWPGEVIFIFGGVMFFIIWASSKFLYCREKSGFQWILFTGRIGLALGLMFRFIYNFAFSPYLVYASVAILIGAYWVQSRVNQAAN